MVSFNKTRQMFPTKLNHEKQLDFMFECSPHLLQFKRDDTKLQKMQLKQNSKGVAVRKANVCYKDSQGATYGLYQRFYWDGKDTVFGGQPGFKAQGMHGPGKYKGQDVYRASETSGGKFSAYKGQKEKIEGPTPTQYFGLGRSELNLESSNKFERQPRPEIFTLLPDNNNTLFHKDKGKGARTETKGYKFSSQKQAQDMPVENQGLPGPGQYETGNVLTDTTFGQKAPAYTLRTSG